MLKLQTGDWLATPPPPPDWLVEPVFVHPNKILFAGESGAFKSWVLADLSLHMAAGVDWLGFKVPKSRKVVFINEDMSEDDLRARFYQLAVGSKIDPRNLPLWVSNGHNVKLGLNKLGQPMLTWNFLNDLKQQGVDPDVVVFETLLRVAAGQSNSNDDMADFYNALKPLTDDSLNPRTVIISHHLTKFAGEPDNPIPMDKRILGAGYVKGGADAVFAAQVEDERNRIIQISFHKMRRGPIHDPFMVHLECDGIDRPARIVRSAKKEKPKPVLVVGPAVGPFAKPAPAP